MSRVTRTCLLLILALAAALRLAGLDFGLPLLYVRPDEYTIVIVNQNMALSGSLNPHNFVYPGFAFYLFFACDWLLFEAVRVVVPATAAGSLAEFIAGAPDTLLWIHRLVSAGLGTATVYVVFLLGRSLSNPRVGLGAALLTAVAFLHVRDSHFGTVDVAVTLTVCLTLLAALRHLRTGTLVSLLVAAGLAGLAAAQKYNAGSVCASVAVAHFVAARGRGRAAFAPRVFAAGLVTAAVFIVAAPYTLLDLGGFLGQFDRLWDLFRDWGPGDSVAGPFSAAKKHLLVALRYGLGEPLLAVALVAVVAVVVRPHGRRWTLAAFVLAYFAAMISGTAAFFRYMVPLVPVLTVLAADAVDRFAGRLANLRLARVAAVVVVLGLAAIPLARSIAFDRCLQRADTRLQVLDWVRSQVARDEVVMVGGWVGHDLRTSLRTLSPDHTLVRCSPGDLLRGEVSYLITAGDHPLYDDHFPGRAELLQRVVHAELVFESVGLEAGAGSDAVFDGQDAFLTPYAGFAGCSRPGPTMRVWRIDGRRAGVAAAPPGAPDDFTVQRSGRALRLAWSTPRENDLLCTLVYLIGRRQVTHGFRAAPRRILPPDQVTTEVADLAPGAYLTVVSFLGLGGESPPSKLVEIKVP